MPLAAAAAAVLALCAPGAVALSGRAGGDPAAHRPRYARVKGNIETLWQPPLGDRVRGLLFLAHGCTHQATDFFADRGQDGWGLRECASSDFGRCLGLPLERQLVRDARERGYLVVAVSGTGVSRCWQEWDVHRVEVALEHVLEVEGLDPRTPLLAAGASSGGSFMGLLAQSSLGERLRCVAPQISDADLGTSRVPAIFVHMPRDGRTARRVKRRVRGLRARGVRAAELAVAPTPVDPALLSPAMGPEQAESVVAALRQAGHLDGAGLLLEDPRVSGWRDAVRAAAPPGDSLVADESPLAELLNLAWAMHELVGGRAREILDFCERASP